VAQVLNRLDGKPFDDADQRLFEAFVIFCGLGINNTIMYDQVKKSWAKQSVALDVLSYHATCSKAEVDKFKAANIPLVSELAIDDIHFDDFSLDVDAMITAALRMFMELGMVQKFKIDYETAGFQEILTEVEILAPIRLRGMTSCLDLLLSNLVLRSDSALAQLYGTSATLEHHHFNHAVMILQSEGHNIFANLSSKEYSDLMQLLKQSILATDLTLYFERRTEFFELVSKGDYDWNIKSHRDVFRNYSDQKSITNHLPQQKQSLVAELVTSEFFEQGDRERSELKLTPSAIFDRNRKDELPRLQLEWIDGICMPLYQVLLTCECLCVLPEVKKESMGKEISLFKDQEEGFTFPEPSGITCRRQAFGDVHISALVKVNAKLKPMLDSVAANRRKWEELHQKRLQVSAASPVPASLMVAGEDRM
ncbi:hypothetical protein A6R68_21677, partial [Neotoma lepida]